MIVTIIYTTDRKTTATVQTAMSPEQLKDQAAALKAAQEYMDSLNWIKGAKVLGLDIQQNHGRLHRRSLAIPGGPTAR